MSIPRKYHLQGKRDKWHEVYVTSRTKKKYGSKIQPVNSNNQISLLLHFISLLLCKTTNAIGGVNLDLVCGQPDTMKCCQIKSVNIHFEHFQIQFQINEALKKPLKFAQFVEPQSIEP